MPRVWRLADLVRDDDEVVYADAGCQGVGQRADVAGDENLSRVEFRVAARKGTLCSMHVHEQGVESRKASVGAKVEHLFLVVKRDFGLSRLATGG